MNTIIVGEVDWMRNDYCDDLVVNGITYPTLEHAYQAAKFTDPLIKREIADADDVRAARSIGRNKSGIRDDWDDVKRGVMSSLIRRKFSTNDQLAERLAKTGDAEIVMEGYDEFWGTGRSGYGENALGKILMEIREEIQLVTGITGDDEPEEAQEDEAVPSLKDAILNNPDNDLASACQNLFVGVKALMTLVDPSDFDAAFVSRRTGVSMETAESAIVKLQSMVSAINSLDDLLKEEDDSPVIGGTAAHMLTPPDDDDDDDYDDHPNDDWLSSFD